MRTLRFISAAVGAPAAAAVAFYISWFASLFLFASPSSGQARDYWGAVSKVPETWPIAVYALVCALLTEVVVGLPLLVVFRRMGWLSFRAFLIGGCLVALPFFFVMHSPAPPGRTAIAFLLVLIPSCVGALVFGYLGGWLTGRSSGPA